MEEVQTKKNTCFLIETNWYIHWHSLVEDYRPGYPRFTALLSAYKPYFVCRRLNKLRARVLFLKQDRLSVLEERLERIDHEEASPLFLGKLRCDRNLERISLLSDIESGLADYSKYGKWKILLAYWLKSDRFAECTYRMMNLNLTQQRDVKGLQNWLDGSGNVARAERSYLLHHRELVSLTPVEDSAKVQLEAWVEDKFIQWWRGFRKVRRMCEVSWRADNRIARLS